MSFLLLEHQGSHVEKLLEILETNHFAFDTSQGGSGKSYTSAKISERLDLPILTFAPKTVSITWNNLIDEYCDDEEDGFETYGVNGYSLLGKKKCDMFFSSGGKFYIKKNLRSAIDRGMLFVIDEVHRLAGDSDAAKCITTLVNYIKGGKSKILFLSATLEDDNRFAENILNLLSISAEDLQLKPEKTKSRRRKLGDSDVKKLKPKKILEHVIKKYSSSMKRVFNPDINVSILKESYNLQGDDLENYNEIIKRVKNYDKKIKSNVLALQACKTNVILREAERVLNKNENAHVVLFSRSISILNAWKVGLNKFNPKVLDSKSKKEKIISDFQEPNNKSRLLLASLITAREGLSLHDLHGNFPRYAFISSGYNIGEIQQAIDRVCRVGACSDITVRIVYGPQIEEEISLESLHAKSFIGDNVISHKIEKL